MASDAGILSGIINSVKSMTDSQNQFKAAASASNQNMTRMAKDVADTFARQKRDINTISQNINTVSSHGQVTSARIQNTNQLLQQSIAIQNSMFQEIRRMSTSFGDLSTFMQSRGSQGFGGMISSMLGRGGAGVVGMGVAGAVGAAGAVAASGGDITKILSGNRPGGEQSDATPNRSGGQGRSAPTGTPRGAMSMKDIVKAAKDAGFSDQEAVIAASIARSESGGRATSHNPNRSTGDNSYGLWQINMLDRMGPERRAKLGISSNEELFNPQVNAKAAYMLYRGRGNFNDWSDYKNGKYRAYMGQAQEALRELNSGGNTSPQRTGQTGEGTQRQQSGNSLAGNAGNLYRLGGGITGNEGNVSRLNNDLQGALAGALKEYKEKTGKTATITSGHRTSEEQARISPTYGIKAAPGRSKHEHGSAVDISAADARAMERLGILERHGLHRPLGERDPVHIELKNRGREHQGASPREGAGRETTPRQGTPAGERETQKPTSASSAADILKMLGGTGVSGAAGFMPMMAMGPGSLGMRGLGALGSMIGGLLGRSGITPGEMTPATRQEAPTVTPRVSRPEETVTPSRRTEETPKPEAQTPVLPTPTTFERAKTAPEGTQVPSQALPMFTQPQRNFGTSFNQAAITEETRKDEAQRRIAEATERASTAQQTQPQGQPQSQSGYRDSPGESGNTDEKNVYATWSDRLYEFYA